jgi:formylglycine-generating enzyme required for sulfatase activity
MATHLPMQPAPHQFLDLATMKPLIQQAIQLIGVLALAWATPVWAARLALVIGNDSYTQVSTLKNAGNDARLMASTLRSAGFEVIDHFNLDRNRLYDVVDGFQKRIHKGDEVIFYFSGHGVQLDNDPMLLPIDVQAADEKKLKREALPVLYVQDALKDARVSLLVIDACRDNPFPKTGTRSLGDTRGLRPPDVVKGQAIIMSAGRNQKALDTVPGEPNQRNGLFTHEFVRVIRTPGLDLRSALIKVRDDVEDKAAKINHEQRPSLIDDMRGSFYLQASLRPEPLSVTPPPPPAPVQARPIETEPIQSSARQSVKDCDVCPELVLIPAGSFQMGSIEHVASKPIRTVNIKSFLLGKTEVTQGQWKALMGSNPSAFKNCGDNCPVENVSWDDAKQYIQKLNARSRKQYRLPSEAEWEYTARAGSGGKWSFGDDESQLPNHAWFKDNRAGNTQGVGQKQANAFGLFDMHGNVWEWVQDCFHESYTGAPSDGRAWTSSCNGGERVLRGGSWSNGAAVLQSADRVRSFPDLRNDYIGFRLARTAP